MDILVAHSRLQAQSKSIMSSHAMDGEGDWDRSSQTQERALTLASLSLSANGLFNPFYGHSHVGAGQLLEEGTRRGKKEERRGHAGSRRRWSDEQNISNGRRARDDAADEVNMWLSQRQDHSRRNGHVITAGLGGSWDAGRAFKDALRRNTSITPLGKPQATRVACKTPFVNVPATKTRPWHSTNKQHS